ncbi:MAG: 50S ribosomal protein L17 [Paludibacteraceae bacterium]|nr:50S ribosomal protein L17 [Paludibacteraceae bacterium]
MRHNKKFNHLGRKAAHRHAMLSNMACSLIMHKRISTTLAKAKALRMYVEPLLTHAKEDSTANRRLVFAKLKQKTVVTELFQNVAEKIANRPGGYTRILRTGFRLGDAAEMAIIELVDYNENMLKTPKAAKKTTRRAGKKVAPKTEEAAVEAPVAESAE